MFFFLQHSIFRLFFVLSVFLFQIHTYINSSICFKVSIKLFCFQVSKSKFQPSTFSHLVLFPGDNLPSVKSIKVHELRMMYLVWTLYMNLKWCVLYEHCTWTYDDVSCMNIVRELNIVHELTMMYLVWTLYVNLKWCILYEHCTWTYDDVSCMNIVHELTMMYLVWTLYMNLQ